MTGAQAVAGEENLGIALALADVVVGALQQLNGSPGAQVGAADADDHEHIAVFPNLLGGGLDALNFLGGLPNGQVQPAQEIVALTGAVHQGGVGIGHFLFHSQQVAQGQLTPDIGDINFNHVMEHVLSQSTTVFYRKPEPNASKTFLSVIFVRGWLFSAEYV